MRISHLVATALIGVVGLMPVTASAALYIEGENGLVFHSMSMPHCHQDGKSSVHCEDRHGAFPGQINFSFHGHRAGCVIGGVRYYEYKIGQYRWDASVYKDYSKECHGSWWNNNTLHIMGTEK